MADTEEPINNFPVEDFKTLYFECRRRLVENGPPGTEFCALMDQIIELHTKELPLATGITLDNLDLIVPGFAPILKNYLHAFAHISFEMGRQYEIEAALLDLSDVSITDFTK